MADVVAKGGIGPLRAPCGASGECMRATYYRTQDGAPSGQTGTCMLQCPIGTDRHMSPGRW
eukprot:106813-Prymnesium_polylepis.1